MVIAFLKLPNIRQHRQLFRYSKDRHLEMLNMEIFLKSKQAFWYSSFEHILFNFLISYWYDGKQLQIACFIHCLKSSDHVKMPT